MEEVGKILPAVIRKRIRLDEPTVIEVLAPFWPRIAGKPIAKQTRLASFKYGTLTLVTSCPSWAAELRQMAEEIRAGINGFLQKPVVKKLRVQRVQTLERTQQKPTRELVASARHGDAGVALNGRQNKAQ